MILFEHDIFLYNKNSKKILEYLLENKLIDGIECYYSTFTTEQTQYLLDICKEHNLYISGGSDYHGTKRPDIDIGIRERRSKNIR